MGKEIKILIVEDHPLIVSAYKDALAQVGHKLNLTLNIRRVSTVKEFKRIIEDDRYFASMDLVFLDINLPFKNTAFRETGEDIGLKIRSLYNHIKVVICTAINDNYTIHRILQKINPEAILIKDDITPPDLLFAIEAVIKDTPYYSKKVLKLLRTALLFDHPLDEIDRRILYELSNGTKLKDLPKILPLSLGGIEHRKRNLERIFGLKRNGEQSLLKCARSKGII